MKWVQLYDSLNILWHCLPLRLEWKLTFSSPVATAEFPKFAGIWSLSSCSLKASVCVCVCVCVFICVLKGVICSVSLLHNWLRPIPTFCVAEVLFPKSSGSFGELSVTPLSLFLLCKIYLFLSVHTMIWLIYSSWLITHWIGQYSIWFTFVVIS